MRQDFRVCLGRKFMAPGYQAVLEIKVVLDDAVMRNIESPGAITVRMRVDFAGPPMCRPACVADTAFNGSVGRIRFFYSFLELANPADRADDVGLAFVDDRNAA